MLFIITILIIILSINGFIALNKRILNKRNYILFQKNVINDIFKEKPMYTIIWKRNPAIEILIEDLKKNKMSVTFIDEIIYADNDKFFKYSDEPMILENDYYIGSFFEIYYKIFQKL